MEPVRGERDELVEEVRAVPRISCRGEVIPNQQVGLPEPGAWRTLLKRAVKLLRCQYFPSRAVCFGRVSGLRVFALTPRVKHPGPAEAGAGANSTRATCPHWWRGAQQIVVLKQCIFFWEQCWWAEGNGNFFLTCFHRAFCTAAHISVISTVFFFFSPLRTPPHQLCQLPRK